MIVPDMSATNTSPVLYILTAILSQEESNLWRRRDVVQGRVPTPEAPKERCKDPLTGTSVEMRDRGR